MMSEFEPMTPHTSTCTALYLATNTDYDTAVKTLNTPCTAEEWRAMVWWMYRHAPQHEKQAVQNGWMKKSWMRWNISRDEIIDTANNISSSILADNRHAKEAKFFWAYLTLPTYKRFRPFITSYNTGERNIAEKYDLYLNAMVESLMWTVSFASEEMRREVERIEEEKEYRENRD